ncbi:MAG: DUF305 domain-containing protein [Gemmatimonadetes bacterium]|nr:DUF305 domain-containing protein [Gemmatimonadota bacterium]MBI2402852.1 DUF305 domain-containing protein [Gemmatimonadota bacterium]MBI2614867.1 DUF305 domain-containing protein [Gemmatimonadota bacterium]
MATARFGALMLLGLVGGYRPAVGQAAGAPAAQGPAYPGRYPFTEADVQFVTGMISHHAQAIVMAGWAPTHDASESIQRLSERIINAQTDEIALMQAWLRDRDQPVPEAKPMPVKMMMHGMEHEMMMPGMLSDEQMQQLDQARGGEFDRLFLTFMIQHHRGAVTMVEQLLSSPGAGQDEAVYKFSSDIYADQTTEIERMTKMLLTLPLR